MQNGGFFESLGNTLGAILRAIVGALKYVLGGFGRALGEFWHGIANAMGMSANVFNLVVLVVGVLFLYAAIRSLLNRSLLGFLFWVILAVLLLGGLIGS
jgi:hypothetical protein